MNESAICLGRPNHLKFLTSCLRQILPGPFLNTFTQIINPHLINWYKEVKRCNTSKKLTDEIMNPPVLLALYWKENWIIFFRKFKFHNNRLDVRDTNNYSSRNLKPEQINLFWEILDDFIPNSMIKLERRLYQQKTYYH